MSRLIDADALLAKFNKKSDLWTALTDEKTANDFALYCKVADAIEDTPTVNGCISVKDGLPDQQRMEKKIDFIESYIKIGNSDYQWQDNHGELVRCKNCKHRPIQTEPPKTRGFSIEFPEGKKCPCCCDDGYYSWYPDDDWFCADGERRS